MAERVFAMPDLGEGLEEGEIVSWRVAAGDEVELNQPIVEVETAKATVEIPSPFAGTISTLHASAGDSVTVGAPLVTFQVVGAGDAAGEPSRPAPQASQPAAATPAVRRLAKDLGIDLAIVAGTGPDGRVSAEDVQRAAGAAGVDAGDADRVPLSPVRRTIARRMEQAASIPQVTTFRTVDATNLEAVRAELGVSPLPLFVAALCRTIAGHPILNATWADDAIVVHATVHAGIAVDTERGLFMSVIHDAELEGRGGTLRGDTPPRGGRPRRFAPAGRVDGRHDLGQQHRELRQRGRHAPPQPARRRHDRARGHRDRTPWSPAAAAVEARPACTISLTFDHRVLDGAAAGRALTDLVDLLEDADALRELSR